MSDLPSTQLSSETADRIAEQTAGAKSQRPRLAFIVESGTDVRLVDGLRDVCQLSVVARRIENGREISQEPQEAVPLQVGPAGRPAFAELVFRTLINKRNEYDACLVQGYGLAALAANCAAKLTRKPTLMVVCAATEEYYKCRQAAHDPQAPFRGVEHGILTTLSTLNARLAGGYVVLSQHLEAAVRSHGAKSPIRVIPIYGVDVKVFKPSGAEKTELRQRLGIPTTGALIFSSSRVAPEKDTSTLLKAFARLLRDGRDVWLMTLTGRHDQFRQMARQYQVEDRVIVADAVHPCEQLPDYYRASDLCVQVSRAEGLGFSPLEALACGTPVVATAVGGLRETIVDGLTGWSHAPGNAEDLAAKMTEALDSPDEAARRAAAGRAMVCSHYESEAAFRAFSSYLDEVLHKS